MKKCLLAVIILMMATPAIGGEIVTMPYYVMLSNPLTDQGEKLSITFMYEQSGNHYAVIRYRILSDSGNEIMHNLELVIRDLPDDPESITANCVAVGDPWPLCTGAGTCTNDCDESTTDFTDFVAGFGGTLKSRSETAMSNDIQSRFTTQAK